MATSDRHAHHVAATAELGSAPAIGRSELPMRSTARIDAARQEARKLVLAVERRRGQLDAEFSETTADHQQISDAVASARSHHRSVVHGQAALDAETVDLAARIEAMDLAISEHRNDIESATGQLEANRSEQDQLARTVAAVRLTESLAELDLRQIQVGSGDRSQHPAVVTAWADLAATQRELNELDEHAQAGTLAQHTMDAIESTHDRRVQLESARRGVTPVALAGAIAAEAAALSRLGFDSMIDYKIAVSTKGAGLLAATRREVTAAAVADAEQELETALGQAGREHDELRQLEQELLIAAAELTDAHTDDARPALAQMSDVSDDAAEDLRELAARTSELRNRRSAGEAALTCLVDERELISDGSTQLAEATSLVAAALADAETTVTSTENELKHHDGLLAELAVRADALDAEQQKASGVLATLSSRRYLAEDVDELRAALLEAIIERAELAGMNNAEQTAVVIDDPLDELDVDDARSIFHNLLALDLGVDVHFVTSRKELLASARGALTDVHVVDGRARLPRTPRWGRRRSRAATAVATDHG